MKVASISLDLVMAKRIEEELHSFFSNSMMAKKKGKKSYKGFPEI
jgi:hypothetical protein